MEHHSCTEAPLSGVVVQPTTRESCMVVDDLVAPFPVSSRSGICPSRLRGNGQISNKLAVHCEREVTWVGRQPSYGFDREAQRLALPPGCGGEERNLGGCPIE